jgi:3-phenylpropionate/trans-cinnamate dioxygenase ferredoxin reductase subunit
VSDAVIVGAGQAGLQAAASLRQAGWEGSITIVGAEAHPPYQRPPLSKAVLLGEAEPDSVRLRPPTFYEKNAIDVVGGTPAQAIDREAHEVVLADGRRLPYSHLVLATGSRARSLPVPGAELDGVHELRTVEEAVALRDRLGEGVRVVIVGGGFIGLEVAASAARRGAQVTVVEALDRTMARVVSSPISDHISARHAREGTTVHHDTTVGEILGRDGQVTGVLLAGGGELSADVVVVGIGVAPETGLALAAGLPVDDGILVDASLRTEDPAIWAIGDCARFPLPSGRSVRLESVQNATDQGRAVGAAIAGTPAPYDTVPWFWSDQHDMKLQIAGLADGHDATVLRGDPATGAFSVFCFAGDTLVAVESVNRMKDHMAARSLLAAGVAVTPEQAADDDCDLKALAAG